MVLGWELVVCRDEIDDDDEQHNLCWYDGDETYFGGYSSFMCGICLKIEPIYSAIHDLKMYDFHLDVLDHVNDVVEHGED